MYLCQSSFLFIFSKTFKSTQPDVHRKVHLLSHNSSKTYSGCSGSCFHSVCLVRKFGEPARSGMTNSRFHSCVPGMISIILSILMIIISSSDARALSVRTSTLWRVSFPQLSLSLRELILPARSVIVTKGFFLVFFCCCGMTCSCATPTILEP